MSPHGLSDAAADHGDMWLRAEPETQRTA
eukprot:COSAG06_NODE_11683_length_1477_cov_1.160377_1_plen_28_part_10